MYADRWMNGWKLFVVRILCRGSSVMIYGMIGGFSMKRPMPEGLNPYLAPYGGWKIVSFVSCGDDLRINYRCVSCRAIYSKSTDTCPNCGKYMKCRSESEVESD